jgi:hypothetical protein
MWGEIIVAGVVVLLGGGIVRWVIKSSLTSVLVQNKAVQEQGRQLIEGALDNMKANTSAIEANTQATRNLSESIAVRNAVDGERNARILDSLRRIEEQTKGGVAR